MRRRDSKVAHTLSCGYSSSTLHLSCYPCVSPVQRRSASATNGGGRHQLRVDLAPLAFRNVITAGIWYSSSVAYCICDPNRPGLSYYVSSGGLTDPPTPHLPAGHMPRCKLTATQEFPTPLMPAAPFCVLVSNVQRSSANRFLHLFGLPTMRRALKEGQDQGEQGEDQAEQAAAVASGERCRGGWGERRWPDMLCLCSVFN